MRCLSSLIPALTRLCTCAGNRECVFSVTLETPTTFVHSDNKIQIIELIHDSEVLVPARIERISGCDGAHSAGKSVYLLVDDVADRFGTESIAGKQFEVRLAQKERDIWDYRITSL